MSTLTHRVAAIQIKIFHLQFRIKKIYEDQLVLNSRLSSYKSNRDLIKGMMYVVYNTIDMIIAFEHLYQLFNDVFNTQELKDKFDKEICVSMGKAKKIALKWISIRNKLGGHIDIEIIEDLCKKYNFKGVFISGDLEADIGFLNMLLIESAVNCVHNKSGIIDRVLDFRKNGIEQEIKFFVESLNKLDSLNFTHILSSIPNYAAI